MRAHGCRGTCSAAGRHKERSGNGAGEARHQKTTFGRSSGHGVLRALWQAENYFEDVDKDRQLLMSFHDVGPKLAELEEALKKQAAEASALCDAFHRIKDSLSANATEESPKETHSPCEQRPLECTQPGPAQDFDSELPATGKPEQGMELEAEPRIEVASEAQSDLLHVEAFGTEDAELKEVTELEELQHKTHIEGNTYEPSGWETASECQSASEASNSGAESVAGHSTLSASRTTVPSPIDCSNLAEGKVDCDVAELVEDARSRVPSIRLEDLAGQPCIYLVTFLPCRDLFSLRLTSKMALADTAQEIQDRLKKIWFEALSPSSTGADSSGERRAAHADESSEGESRPHRTPNDVAIFLNVYDVTHYSGVQWLNALFANQYSPIKFGGIFHVGVQIGHKEWSYGYKADGTGVFWTPPLYQAAHHFRESIRMQPTHLTQEEISNVIRDLEAEWTGPSYNVFRRNCCHFADAVCQRLGVGPLPEWTYRLANIGSTAAEAFRLLDGPVLPLSMCSRAPAALPAPDVVTKHEAQEVRTFEA